MNSQQKVDCKRCIQVLMPSVPGPLVDYALNSPFFASASVAAGNGAGNKHPRDSPADPGHFTCRKMESGDFGELSILSPKGGRHLKKYSFGEPAALNFSYEELTSK